MKKILITITVVLTGLIFSINKINANENNLIVTGGTELRFTTNQFELERGALWMLEDDTDDYELDHTINVDYSVKTTQKLIVATETFNLNPGDNLRIERERTDHETYVDVQKIYQNNNLIYEKTRTGNGHEKVTVIESNLITNFENKLNHNLSFINTNIRQQFVDSREKYYLSFELNYFKKDLYQKGKEYSLITPEGFNLYYFDNVNKIYTTFKGNIKIKNEVISSSDYWSIYLNDVYLDKTSGIGSNPTTTHKLVFISDSIKLITLTTPSNYPTNNYKAIKNDPILFDRIIKLEDKLPVHQIYNYYYEKELINPIKKTDLVTNNIKIYQTIEMSEDDSFTLTFDTSGGNTINPLVYSRRDYGIKANAYFKLRDFMNELPVPTKEGHTFQKWVMIGDENYKYDLLDKQINSDVTLKAIFIENTSKVIVTIVGNTFGGNSGTKTIELNVGDKISAGDIELVKRAGKRFVKFDDGVGGNFDFNSPIIKDTKVYLIWEDVVNLNVTFNVNGGVYLSPIKLDKINLPGGSMNVYSFAKELPEAIKAKAIFAGWFLDEELTIPAPLTYRLDNIDDIYLYDVILYANFIENAVKVYFHTNTTALEISPIIITKGDSVNISNPPKRVGYIFNGWFLNEELTIEYEAEPLTDDVVNLYASWLKDSTGDGSDDGNENPGETIKDNYDMFIYILFGTFGVLAFLIIFGNSKKKNRGRR